jgi:hypothetical protein
MSKFQLNYFKPKKILLEDLAKQAAETDSTYPPYDMLSFQSYNPLYKLFFELNASNYDSVAFNHRYHVVDLKTVWDSAKSEKASREMFVKFAPLLDPVRYLIGRYKSQAVLDLPSLEGGCHEKLSTPHNASYIDNFFCYLSNQMLHTHGFWHGIEYYGSYVGVQKKYRMNLADDMDYLVQSEYFNENRSKLYELEEGENPFANFGSRNNKNKLNIHGGSNVSRISLDEVLLIEDSIDKVITDDSVEVLQEDCVYEKESVVSSEDSSNDSEVNYSSDEEDEDDEDEDEDEDDEDEDKDDEEDEDKDDEEDEDKDDEKDEDESDKESEEETEVPLNGYIYDFPVQMICLEKCQGTLDRLFLKRILDMETAASALFQVIMTLMAYQKSFAFTHNDLHTNNIMYVETQQEFIYYKVAGGKTYKVPTYGRMFKLIDFGRAIYRFQGRVFCSDSFAPGGDASTQYNCEPFMNEKKPRLDPNMSFDLCRLGCSIYDFILEIEEEQDPEFEPDLLQKTIIDWVTDDHGKNVLYMKNGEERYPNFKLYKMIARTVHGKTPEDQLANPLFASFETVEIPPEGALMIDIDAIPSYVL